MHYTWQKFLDVKKEIFRACSNVTPPRLLVPRSPLSPLPCRRRCLSWKKNLAMKLSTRHYIMKRDFSFSSLKLLTGKKIFVLKEQCSHGFWMPPFFPATVWKAYIPAAPKGKLLGKDRNRMQVTIRSFFFLKGKPALSQPLPTNVHKPSPPALSFRLWQ